MTDLPYWERFWLQQPPRPRPANVAAPAPARHRGLAAGDTCSHPRKVRHARCPLV